MGAGLAPRGANGALLAATQAARGHAAAGGGNKGVNEGGSAAAAVGAGTGSGSGLDGGHGHGGGLVGQRVLDLHAGSGSGGGGSTLLPPPAGRSGADGGGGGGGRKSSPSLIAATLAASRSVSPARGPIPQLDLNGGGGKVTRKRGQSVGAASVIVGSVGPRHEAEVLDTASIPPTTSLVSLFEGKREANDVDPVKKRAPSVRRKDMDTEEQARKERASQEPQKVKPKPVPKPKPKPEVATDVAVPKSSDDAHGASEGTSRLGGTGRSGHGDERGRAEAKPSQRRARSQHSEHKPAKKPKPAQHRPPTPPPSLPTRSPSNHVVSQPKRVAKTPRLEPPTPPVKTSTIAKMAEPIVQVTPVEPDIDQVDVFHHQDRNPKPRQVSQGSTSSNDSFVSASSVPSGAVSPVREVESTPRRPAPPARSPSSRSISTPNPPRQQASHPSTPNLTLSSLTNAMMASNLASARLTPTTPSQPPPLPAPRRSGRSPLQPHHTADSIGSQLTGGSKSPNHAAHQQKQRTGMLQTLRSPHASLSDDEDARRQHHHRRRSKVLSGGNRKHAHHEGSRRRWRDEITARERKRYEAVWASNRGLFLRPGWAAQYQNTTTATTGGASPTQQGHGPGTGEETQHQTRDQAVEASRASHGAEAELVVNVVARDIWSRSRLPADELAEVWDLVDRGARGALGRDEFVVGLWLIDQRLRGRKIPARVSQSVWDSAAGGYQGVVVPLPGGGAGGGGRKGRRA
ncbi:hypothetical protein CHGG_03083 [Chaetomium globosum CBS 148.51]|uniref:Increased rDNA silencing protein 4 n=1 Tax=Chaetomium globosum (strain ATCC 6205 / CBS 148.51 / DSM 1962 / NBRC 6347 / NRRL 1970) TaxID=306901 RepID=IRS4_CHAGB|nr:uncharacterized protein CHGG_03083 [Chaetomium globosum CBS 148.51]Q2H9M1.1 RecName: Full=Increased rDNA silencing protein 4 [Chaetomium globosum CBS 148.51]EAQ91148.1 hypothetical protein CHGG_03083 [Chaetomium globosum CBS 148.51]